MKTLNGGTISTQTGRVHLPIGRIAKIGFQVLVLAMAATLIVVAVEAVDDGNTAAVRLTQSQQADADRWTAQANALLLARGWGASTDRLNEEALRAGIHPRMLERGGRADAQRIQEYAAHLIATEAAIARGWEATAERLQGLAGQE